MARRRATAGLVLALVAGPPPAGAADPGPEGLIEPARPVRLIAPDEVAPAPAAGPLLRLPARLPEHPPAAPPAHGADIRYRLLYRPVMIRAGTLIAGGHSIALAGVEAPALDETCPGPEGAPWPCGMVARTAMRNFVRGRALSCQVPAEPAEEVTVTTCLLAGDDLGAWLVENGWARAADDRFAGEAARARQERRGLFGRPPYADSLPSISAAVSGSP